ncbi:bifunctional proline dehydrogenase/L-glutamate gamma-semialdehyde dehydrogenase PutA [Meridianimarinicoccus sp. RP-17]|uniref:bifunctional proline dehydrogenase/L-glutamate gamma-semialdehyde dehydrogenase PutA n=1 Tax=Meridianimarinicoccus zhengii TaxID=2056810 RepID=UPI000DAD265D|nr:bifunctional proline dehydrogenase/L-glutamate gamma-semialdehyde dehydrogenase PutA [Phycocomes zhengii]
MTTLDDIRLTLRHGTLAPDADVIAALRAGSAIDGGLRAAAGDRAVKLVKGIRNDARPGLMEVFLAEYGLSTEEGIALMCLAEALLRVPDASTIDALIEDKIAPGAWGAHLGHSSSPMVNAATWGLMLTGKVLKDSTGLAQTLRGAVRRLGEPVIRTAVGRAMREMGAQFVLGETIEKAVERGRSMQAKGYTYSYDMLGEAALTAGDAQDYYDAYAQAISRLAGECKASDIRDNPGISIKLSALHPRYDETQRDAVMAELVPRVLALAQQARAAGMGLNIDAEEADRLDLSLDVIEAVLRDGSLAGWDGFGVVVQAYGKRAGHTIDWLHALAVELDRRIMVRLVKGAYWDTEIKRAQVDGLPGFPVFQRKEATDVHFILCAEKLLGMTDRVYPQFATHNAHTVAAVLELAGKDLSRFEFQRLHGMGAALHDLVLAGEKGVRCRIYAPVGAHRDLLAYLVRRLLENGANSSFVNQIVDDSVPPEVVAADPFDAFDRGGTNRAVVPPADLFAPERRNARGWNLRDRADLAEIEAARAPFADHRWAVAPVIAGEVAEGDGHPVVNPARPGDVVGHVRDATEAEVEAALAAATVWKAPAGDRANVLNRAADLMEDRFGEIFALLAREAGKSLFDAVGELREAVDFLRYYAARGRELEASARGVMTCISPWNFPLAIFTGQVAACLAAGNGVLAKPAETTALTAGIAVACLHDAGVPRDVLQLLPGTGASVGAALTGDARVAGVCFTGSTATAQRINRTMAEHLAPTAPLVAETGGLNAMIVDSTALPEQAVKDIVASAFQSAGQRCSALRCLYVQEDVADGVLEMLYGAMDALRLGDPWEISTDVGPVITETARDDIAAYVAQARAEGRLLKELAVPDTGSFVAPAVIAVDGIKAMDREVFGPVLHVARFKARDLDRVIADVNGSGFGLTFGIHSRIDDRVEAVTAALKVGNIYVNRNQIGAIVGSQPFGGEGMSGTGPKAGGPNYVARFTKATARRLAAQPGAAADVASVQAALTRAGGAQPGAISAQSLPGPTGESNRLSVFGRGVILCLGPTAAAAQEQARIAQAHGCRAVMVAPGAVGPLVVDGVLDRAALTELTGFDGVALWAAEDDLRAVRRALAARDGAILPLMAEGDMADRCVVERHVCIDTTAAGGNARLLAAAG